MTWKNITTLAHFYNCMQYNLASLAIPPWLLCRNWHLMINRNFMWLSFCPFVSLLPHQQSLSPCLSASSLCTFGVVYLAYLRSIRIYSSSFLPGLQLQSYPSILCYIFSTIWLVEIKEGESISSSHVRPFQQHHDRKEWNFSLFMHWVPFVCSRCCFLSALLDPICSIGSVSSSSSFTTTSTTVFYLLINKNSKIIFFQKNKKLTGFLLLLFRPAICVTIDRPKF